MRAPAKAPEDVQAIIAELQKRADIYASHPSDAYDLMGMSPWSNAKVLTRARDALTSAYARIGQLEAWVSGYGQLIQKGVQRLQGAYEHAAQTAEGYLFGKTPEEIGESAATVGDIAAAIRALSSSPPTGTVDAVREPKALYDIGRGEAVLFNPGGRFHGWCFKRHADGYYVSHGKLPVIPEPWGPEGLASTPEPKPAPRNLSSIHTDRPVGE